ncbi:MAG: hypothetical protein ACI857_002430 [Arenicella sp.]|jgi:hypothetical protein
MIIDTVLAKRLHPAIKAAWRTQRSVFAHNVVGEMIMKWTSEMI